MKTFKDIVDTLIEGIHGVHAEMQAKDLINENTTFEDMADYAGKHVILTEMKEDNELDR